MVDFLDVLRESNTRRQAEWDPSDKLTPAYRGNESAEAIAFAGDKR